MKNDYLKFLNNTLAEKDKEEVRQFDSFDNPLVFILALPRSASALFEQMVISKYRIGYITNFLAKFHKAPLLGALLEQDILDNSYKSNYKSEYGNTFGALEPHEWGWFWQDKLGLCGDEFYTNEEKIAPELRNTLSAVAKTKGLPLIIDNVYAMANIQHIKKIIPESVMVHVDRDPFYVCNSIINARLSRYGDINSFYGHRPANIDDILSASDPVEQIVRQVISINKEIENSKSVFKKNEVHCVTYKQMCFEPEKTIESFGSFMYELGYGLETKNTSFHELTFRDDPKLIAPEFSDRLKDMLDKYGVS